MNERFWQLVEQADDEGGDDPDIRDEVFATLIIRECISTLEEKIYRSIDNEGDEIWTDLILKEHFGVTE